MFKAIERADAYPSAVAVISGERSYSYADLMRSSDGFAMRLLEGREDLCEARVAFMVDPGFEYVAVQWGIWKAGGVAVPLCTSHPLPSLEYVLDDTQAAFVVVSERYVPLLSAACGQRKIPLLTSSEQKLTDKAIRPVVGDDRRAMILYTSGTTSKPKGVVSTHAALNAQVSTLTEAWRWTAADRILCVLPLHHVHGIVNVVGCALWSGATCRFIGDFSAEEVFRTFLSGEVNLFMAVPTIYFKLIAHWESCPEAERLALTAGMEKFRLMVCGSAALPVSVMEKWKTVSGHTLLERYGMTEIGMAISNPYEGERRAGSVGLPLPGVAVRLVDDTFSDIPHGEPGEILVKGDNVFREYWQRPEATGEAFTPDGWFKTGDVAVVENGYYRILGRKSVDIIKSGGYKISALEIEEILRTHPAISDCAVTALPDAEWGELIVAAIVPGQVDPDIRALNAWMRERMPSYKIPRRYLSLKELPRNAMGKVVKNELKKLFE
jgi:malonyl-CoA/methylmalonyl-CoA synthetase